jgi:site-specific DNA-methyltransferase (adenine-specific)
MIGMARYPDKYFDLVFTSVPFKNGDIGCENDDEYWANYSHWHAEMLRVAKNAVCIIQSATRLNEQIIRFPPKRTIIWNKGFVMMSWRYNPVFIYQVSADYNVNKHIWRVVITVPPMANIDLQKIHPYQDPVNLYCSILKMFDDCKSVLDPFAGSGTTGIAARTNDMEFTGFELDPDYYRMSKQRLDDFMRQPKLIETLEQYEQMSIVDASGK